MVCVGVSRIGKTFVFLLSLLSSAMPFNPDSIYNIENNSINKNKMANNGQFLLQQVGARPNLLEPNNWLANTPYHNPVVMEYGKT